MDILLINGSPKADGFTQQALDSYGAFLKADRGHQYSTVGKLSVPLGLAGCVDCKRSGEVCAEFDDERAFRFIQMASDAISQSDIVVFGTPVYLDMPTAQMIALLTRLNCVAEKSDRKIFENTSAHFVATAYCSGTKAAINIMRGAAEMLGLTIEGRSSREYIQLWRDKKLRGGMRASDVVLLPSDGV